jgi:hypothetical protein
LRPTLTTFALAFLLPILPLAAQNGCKEAGPYLQTAAASLPAPEAPGRQAFSSFQQAAAKAAAAAGNQALSRRIAALRPEAPVTAADSGLASCLLQRYTLARYGERMVEDVQELVGFQTFAVEGKENWSLPEFARQRAWLERRARELGFGFKSYDGRVEELTLTGPKPVLALLTPPIAIR